MLCSSESMSTSPLSIRRSLFTRMGGPCGRCRRTSSRSYGRCGTSAVSYARSGGTRIRSARIPLSTCEFCDARGTHVQLYFFLLWCNQTLEPNPQTPVACVCPRTPHGPLFKCSCFGGGGGGGGERGGGDIPFSKTKQTTQRDVSSLLEGYKTKTYILSHCATVPELHDAAHS